MALSELYARTALSVGATEVSIPNNGTTLQTLTTEGQYQIYLDCSNIALGDYFRLKYYEKVELTGGAKKALWSWIIGGASHAGVMVVAPPVLLKNGWDVTLQRIGGSDRTFDVSVRGDDGAVAEPFELDGVSVSTSEISLISGNTTPQSNTTPGIYQFLVDAGALVKGDEFDFRVYETARSGGTQRLVYNQPMCDVQIGVYASPFFHLRNGWDARLIRTAGSDRAIDASVRRMG